MKRILFFLLLISSMVKGQEQTICGANPWDSINNITILDQRLQPVLVMIGNVGRSFVFICDSNAYNNGLSYITLHYFQTHSGAAAIDSATKNMYYNISSGTGQQYAGALYQSGTTVENTGNMWLLGSIGTAFIKLGQPSTTTGIVIYYNSSNNNTLGLEGNYTKEPYVLTLPINAPSPGQLMYDSANGYLAWETAYTLPTNIGASKFLGTQKTGASQTPTYISLYAASLATLIDTTFRHSGFANNQVLYANGTNSATSSPNLIYSDGKWFYDVVTNTSTIRGFVEAEYQTGTSSARISGIKFRGTSASPTTIVTGDNLISLAGFGYDGTDTTEAASIIMSADGSVSTGIVPGHISFNTHNTSGTSVQALLITNAQRLLPANSIYAKYLAIADSLITHTSFTTNGTLYASSANNIVSGAVGTAGYVWTSNGTSGPPTMQAATGGVASIVAGTNITVSGTTTITVSVSGMYNTDGHDSIGADSTKYLNIDGKNNQIQNDTTWSTSSTGANIAYQVKITASIKNIPDGGHVIIWYRKKTTKWSQISFTGVGANGKTVVAYASSGGVTNTGQTAFMCENVSGNNGYRIDIERVGGYYSATILGKW